MKRAVIGLVVALAAVIAAAGGFFYASMTGKLSGVTAAVDLGEVLPGFELADYDGDTHRLEDYRGQVVVLDFCSHLCPWSRGADEPLTALYNAFSDRGVVFLGIDSHYETPAEDIKAYADTSGKPYPILKDTNHAYADQIGAVVTPEIFVLDGEGRVVYHGAVDNRIRPDGAGSTNYLREALEAVLAGEPVATDRFRAWGCTIKRAS